MLSPLSTPNLILGVGVYIRKKFSRKFSIAAVYFRKFSKKNSEKFSKKNSEKNVENIL